MTTATNDLSKLCDKISLKFGINCLNYGEAHEVILENEGANYASIDQAVPCAVNDNYDLVLFIVRTGSNPKDQVKGGYRNKLSREVTFKLIGNSKNADAEFNLTAIINSIPGLNYTGTDNSAKSIAQTYFGTEEHNFETYFFSIDFTNVETIVCERC
jgi:hypothetical protein